MIPDDAIFGRVGTALPNLMMKQERAGLDRHMPVGINRTRDGDLVEEVEEVELLIEHDRGAEDSSSTGFFESLDRVI